MTVGHSACTQIDIKDLAALLLCWRSMLGVLLLLFAIGNATTTAHAQLRAAETRAFAHQRGALVLLDLKTNHILFSHGLHEAANNPTVTGSTLKPLLLYALLRDGRIDPHTRIACSRWQRINGELVRCAHPDDIRDTDASEALVWSCNSYFERAIERFHDGEIERVLSSYGLTSPTGLMHSEARGTIAPARDLGSRQLLGLGLEGIHTTPLELLEVYRQFATELRQKTPTATLIRDALAQTVDHGMARPARSQALAIAGKTGTAVSGNASIGWFVGYAPAESPKVAIVVRLQRARGTEAGWVAKQILEAWSEQKH
jgi:cell division protein FtsI/penicillin-binding protein 2